MTETSWIIVANSESARIFVNNYVKEKKLNLFREYTDKDLHKKTSDLIIGEQNDFNAGTHVETSDPKFLQANVFSNALAKRLEHFRTDHAFQKLLLVAPPTFLGLMKEHLSKEILKITVTLEKDYGRENEQKLIKLMEEHLS